jgi:hypothetical protein
MKITKKLGLVTLALVLAGITTLLCTTPAMADSPITITLLSGDTTQTAGYTYNNPVADPLNPSLYSSGGVWYDAPVVIDQPGVWVQSPPAQWVSSTAEDSGTEDGSTLDSWRLFQDQFTIPTGATIISADVNVIAADNAFELYLNGILIDSTDTWNPTATVYDPSPEPVDNEIPFQHSVSYTITPQIGVNTLTFVVRNWDNLGSWNPTGLLYSASIIYATSSEPTTTTTTPPTTPTTPPTTPHSVGGTVNQIDKMQVLFPWIGGGIGLVLASLVIKGVWFRRKQVVRNR